MIPATGLERRHGRRVRRDDAWLGPAPSCPRPSRGSSICKSYDMTMRGDATMANWCLLLRSMPACICKSSWTFINTHTHTYTYTYMETCS